MPVVDTMNANDPDNDLHNLMDDATVNDSDNLDSTTAIDADDLEELHLKHIMKMFFGASHAAIAISEAASQALQLYSGSHYGKQPYHTSALMGIGWVNELLTGHPDWI
jgi:hypothetical protein